jgi:DNA-binding MarR family transcriptional regulator
VFAEFEYNRMSGEEFDRSLSYTELQIATGLSHQSLSNALKNLKNKGMIVSLKDQGDGRVIRYRLHQKARDQLNDLNNQMILFAIDSLRQRVGHSSESSNEVNLLANTVMPLNDGQFRDGASRP